MEPGGWELVPRLPVYPQFDDWLTGDLGQQVKKYRMKINAQANQH
ncbi:hypothetical protein B6N60_00935 [Richelia sinica FACHB-800]|uniref:Uncharacterized protein n=1 Tax=Richelia sinica FACHB-800 TaxID=1357546 RepID=A0A975T6C2_9NOST|nr:hypothetical protein [Richelia sinica]QXE22253.1 hypothetical protein B6N60_00935 [Richelia sinica FACHB-800]